jgi:hypothetical protein
LIVGGALTILVSLARWGGSARPGPLFIAGVIVLASLILIFGLLIAWLYKDPQAISTSSQSADLRYVIAILALGSTISLITGGVWDEVWHRQYGGFGDDFLWSPHLLIYTSLFIFGVFAVSGLWFTLRRKGSIREKFQAETHVGLLGLICTFLIVSLPSDVLWHQIYGKDITAWSLPHLLTGSGVVAIALAAAGLALSLVPRSENWKTIDNFFVLEGFALLLISTGTFLLLHIGTAEWEGIKSVSLGTSNPFSRAFWERPEWLYPVVVSSIALFASMFALHAVRRVGAATVVALVVISLRLSYLAAFGSQAQRLNLGYISYLLMLPPAVSLDLWYVFQRHRADNFITLVSGTVIGGITFLAVGLPIIHTALIYPRISSQTLPGMVIMGLLMSFVSGWAGARLGHWIVSLAPHRCEYHPSSRANIYLSIGLATILGGMLIIMLTAQPPVLLIQ